MEKHKLRLLYEVKENEQKTIVSESAGQIKFQHGKEEKCYDKYVAAPEKKNIKFLGYDLRQLQNSGKDLLAETMRKEGFEWKNLQGILPSFNDSAYITLGSHASYNSVTVEKDGRAYAKLDSGTAHTTHICAYSPQEADVELGALRPKQSLLGGYLPVLFNLYQGDERTLEGMYFCDLCDADFAPAMVVRNVIYENASGRVLSEEYLLAGLDGSGKRRKLEHEVFWDAFLTQFSYWKKFEQETAAVDLPVPELKRAYLGCLMAADGMFTGSRAHYGSRWYRHETSDNFPPNFITAAMAFFRCGQTRRVKEIITEMLSHSVDVRGRFIYRQGEKQRYAASGAEYGQILWVIAECARVVTPSGWLADYTDKLAHMGEFLLSVVRPCPEYNDLEVIHTCAEADTNERVHDYMQNTLWGIRGLEALCDLGKIYPIQTAAFSKMAARLRESAVKICKKAELETPYGKLIPFQLQYETVPLTLSSCRETYPPIEDALFEQYLKNNYSRSEVHQGQDYCENTYANYRYYLEMLSSRLLAPEYEDAIVCLRENLGGEFLGMTRLWGQLDDWPAFHYAAFLLERGYVDKFQLLLYAHTQYHGLCGFHTYYEQVSVQPEAMAQRADACLPCVLLAPLMLMQMFCLERMDDGTLELLKGIPESWYQGDGFGIQGVATSRGRVFIRSDRAEGRRRVKVRFEGDFLGKKARMFLNGVDSQKVIGPNGSVYAQGAWLLDLRYQEFEFLLG